MKNPDDRLIELASHSHPMKRPEMRRMRRMRRSVRGSGADQPRRRQPRFARELERGDSAVVVRILALLSDGAMKPALLRGAVEIKSRIHFNRYYLALMLEKGLVVRTNPEHPNSPHQEYERIRPTVR